MEQPAPLYLTPSQILAVNLIAALNVAGPADDHGRPRRLKATELQRDTGIARSTLRAAKNSATSRAPNPDLRTLCRIADKLCIPVAFLLMGPSQWLALARALTDMADMLAAADKVEREAGLNGPQAAVHILRTLKVHPIEPPKSEGHHVDAQQREVLERKNETRRRAALVTAALAQTGARDYASRKLLTALAAALANQASTQTTADAAPELSANPQTE